MIASPAALLVRLREHVHAARDRHGRTRLQEHAWLDRLAQAHAEAMALRCVRLGHGGFAGRAQAIFRVHPGARVSENVAANLGFREPARRALRGWLRSRSHRRNLLGAATLTGLGVAVGDSGRCYFTQLFVTLRDR